MSKQADFEVYQQQVSPNGKTKHPLATCGFSELAISLQPPTGNFFIYLFFFYVRLSRFVYINCAAWLFLKVDLNYTLCIMRLDGK